MPVSSAISEFFQSDNSKVVVGVAVGVGLATALSAGYLYKLKLQNSPPKKWRRVGELSELIGYPIKSCGAIRVNQFDCTQLGLKDGEMRDRVFMIVTPESNFITGRSHPKVVQIIPRFVGDKMVLSAPGMSDIDVDVKKLHSITPSRAVVWGETVDAVECGDEVAKWISRFLLDTEFGLRLVFYPNSFPTRDVREKNRIFPTMEKNDSGALHDATSFMLMTEASLEDLNSKLKDKVTALQFRPNFLVKGPEAFEEDNWKWIRIGNKTIFKNCKPCSRCIFTNIDPQSAERHPEGEPLKTLKQYRKVEECGESPVMGIHLGVRVDGVVKLGDPVYVEAD